MLRSDILGEFVDFEYPMILIELIRKGLPPIAILNIAERLGVSLPELGEILHVSGRTLKRYLDEDKSLPKPLSNRIVPMAKIIVHAEAIFEDIHKVRGWMRSSVPALEGHSPLELLDTFSGTSIVEQILGRIEWGVYS